MSGSKSRKTRIAASGRPGDSSRFNSKAAAISPSQERHPLQHIGCASSATRTGTLVMRLMGLAIGAAAFLVDPWAEASFDAPKHMAIVLIGLAAISVLLFAPLKFEWHKWTRNAQIVVVVWGVTIGLALLSCIMATQHETAIDKLRTMAFYGLFVLFGAQSIFTTAQWRWLFYLTLTAIVANGAISLAQLAGLSLPLAVTWVGRLNSGALLGNEGYVALASALLGSGCLALILLSQTQRQRVLATLCLCFVLSCIFFNQQRTSIMVLLITSAALLVLKWRWLRTVNTALAVFLFLVFLAAQPKLAHPLWMRLTQPQIDQIQAATSYRLSAWVSASEMIRHHPWLGSGPGGFAQQSSANRLQAEALLTKRFRLPPKANAHTEAHQEYWQWAAEIGLPALLVLTMALWMIMANLVRRWCQLKCLESAIVFAVLCAGAMAALTWFPMQIPLTALILLIALGRGWRLIASSHEEPFKEIAPCPQK